MNDFSEGMLIERALNEKLNLRKNIEDDERGSPMRATASLKENRPEFYACCFSTERDSTTHWLNYADGGRGFSIGFEAKSLWQNRLQPHNHSIWEGNTYVVPVNTSVNPEERLALTPLLYADSKMVDEIVGPLSQAVGLPLRPEKQDELAHTISFYNAISKDHAFRHEREWRLIYAPTIVPPFPPPSGAQIGRPIIHGHLEPLMWRAGPYGITPYFEFGFKAESIKEIWIGPKNPEHQDKVARHLLIDLLHLNGFWSVTTRESKAPYR